MKGITEAVRDARETRRLERMGGAVLKRYARRTESQREKLRSRILGVEALHALGLAAPLLVPFLIHLGAPVPGPGWTHPDPLPPLLHFWAALAVIVFGARGTQWSLLSFDSFDMLRFPSKPGLFLARLRSRLPALLWIGACWAAAWAIHLADALRAEPIGGTALLLAIGLVPLLWLLGHVRTQLTGVEHFVLGPVLLLALCVVAMVLFTRALLEESDLDPGLDVRALVMTVVVGAVALFLAHCVFSTWLRHRRRALQATWADLMIAPRWLVAAGLLVPSTTWAAAPLVWIGYGVLAAVLVAIVVGLQRILPLLQYAEEKPQRNRTAPDEEDEADEAKVPISVDDNNDRRGRTRDVPAAVLHPLPTRHRGQTSLLRAELLRHVRTVVPTRQELRGFRSAFGMLIGSGFLLVWHLWGVLLATLAIALTTPSSLHVLLPVLAALTAPKLVSRAPDHERWLRGADYRQQMRHDLWCLAFLAALPTLLAAAVTGFVLGWTLERAGVLLLLAGLLACRGGFSGLLHENEFDSLPTRRTWALVLLVVTLLALPRLGLDLPATWMAWTGAFLLATGLVGVLLRLVRLDERELVRAMGAREER